MILRKTNAVVSPWIQTYCSTQVAVQPGPSRAVQTLLPYVHSLGSISADDAPCHGNPRLLWGDFSPGRWRAPLGRPFR